MTTAAALVADCRARGITLAVEGDRLVARGHGLPPDLADQLAAHKPAVVAIVRAETLDRETVARLRDVYCDLTLAERDRLAAEAAAGDRLAARLVAEVRR